MANSTATHFYGERPSAAIASIMQSSALLKTLLVLDGNLIFDSFRAGHGVALNRRDG
jgi:hypothetical protein